MLIYENLRQQFPFTFLEPLIPAHVHEHIIRIMNASSTSEFSCKIEDTTPNIYIYLIESSLRESYKIGHFFFCDRIGIDYTYQSMPLEQIVTFGQFISQLSNL